MGDTSPNALGAFGCLGDFLHDWRSGKELPARPRRPWAIKGILFGARPRRPWAIKGILFGGLHGDF
jgi:hypothetical protein